MTAWIRSAFCSNNGCIEVACSCGDQLWLKSSFSDTFNSCLEVAHEDHRVLLRDSKYEERGEESPIIEFTPSGWRSFLIIAQEWDRESEVYTSGVILDRTASDHPVMIVAAAGADLHFTWEEWDAFVKGAAAGEFLPEAS